jgi:hypothetical protein
MDGFDVLQFQHIVIIEAKSLSVCYTAKTDVFNLFFYWNKVSSFLDNHWKSLFIIQNSCWIGMNCSWIFTVKIASLFSDTSCQVIVISIVVIIDLLFQWFTAT